MLKNAVVWILERLRMRGMANNVIYWVSVKWDTTPWCRAQHMKAMQSFYSQFIGEGDLCFDVGANVGERTEVFRRLGGTVIAIEPQDVCVQHLVERYGSDEKVRIVAKALGEREGEAEMMLSNGSNISSMSKKWIDSVKARGMFSKYNWDTKVTVPVTTLDKLIEEYGKPAFCKIDVEGFEFEVLKGLSQSIKAISIEFAPYFPDEPIKAIKRLSGLGMTRFNYSVGESMRLELHEWVGSDRICEILKSSWPSQWYGDVYATASLDGP